MKIAASSVHVLLIYCLLACHGSDALTLHARRPWLAGCGGIVGGVVGCGPVFAGDISAQRATGNIRVDAEGQPLLDIDDAIGIKWGGYDRCDAADAFCGPDGKTLEARAPLPPPPLPSQKDGESDDNGPLLVVTDVVELDFTVGRYAAGSLQLGLFGNAYPNTVAAVKSLCQGTYLGDSFAPEDGGQAFPNGYTFGSVLGVERGVKISVGVADPGVAFAKRRGLRKPPDDFVRPAPPPSDGALSTTTATLDQLGGPLPALRSHAVAGFVSVPKGGMGNDFALTISTFAPEAEAGGVTGALLKAAVALDRSNTVVGVLLGQPSMDLLGRFDNLPVQRAYGKNGQPMLKTSIAATRIVVK